MKKPRRILSTLIVSIACLIIGGSEAGAQWKETQIRGDWKGRDFACTLGQDPDGTKCNAATKGLVAVCWPSRKTGGCGGSGPWCTYKKITVSTPPDGSTPGKVYTCN
jgi:hypothetical protein